MWEMAHGQRLIRPTACCSAKGEAMFSSLIVAYLFAGGMGGGATMVLGVLCLMSFSRGRSLASVETVLYASEPRRVIPASLPSCRVLARSFGAASVALLAGISCLVLDVGRAERMLDLFVPRLTFLTFGAYALAACLFIALIVGSLWGFPWCSVRTTLFVALHALAIVVGLAVVLHASILPASIPAVPLWHSPWLVVLFALSSLSCGLALVLGVVHVSGRTSDVSCVRALSGIDMVFLALEGAACLLLALGGFAASASGSNGTEVALAASLETLLFGDGSWVFWLGFVAVGLCGAIVADFTVVLRPDNNVVGLTASACVMVGGFVLRWCVVAAATHPFIMESLMAFGAG